MSRGCRLLAVVALLIVVMPLAAGCTFKDIDRRMFVTAIGIDRGDREGRFRVSLKLALPQGDPTKAQEGVAVVSQEAESISEALRLMKSKVEKELDYAHCKALIIGEEQARADIGHIADWAVRRRDIQLIMNVAVGRPNAMKVLELKSKTERLPSNALILSLSRQGTQSPFITSVYLYRMYRALYQPGEDPVLPIIEAKGKSEFTMDRIALFNKHRLRLELGPDEARLFNLLDRSDLQTNFPARYKGGLYEYYTEKSKSKYSISGRGAARPKLVYTISIEGILEENSTQSLVSYGLLQEITGASEEELKEQVEALLVKIRDSGLDPLGWGLHYGARRFDNEREMKDWKELRGDLELTARVKVRIKYSGMIK